MVYEIFEKLLADNSRLAKEAVLKENLNNETLKRVLMLALNPYIRFHVRKTPTEYAGNGTMTLAEAMDKLSYLSSREITGNAAIEFLANLFHSLTVDDAKVLKKIIDKDLKCGVSTSTVNKIWPKLIPEFDVQLCAGYDPKKLPKRFGVEPKIDGMRILVMNEDGNIAFTTRGGREWDSLDHLKPEINRLMNDATNYVLDTEVFSEGGMEATSSAAKRKGKAKGDVFLYCFDLLTMDEFLSKKCDRIFEERRAKLEGLFAEHDATHLKLNELDVWDETGDPLKFVSDHFAGMRQKKIEGTIVKDLDGFYEFDRTHAWMKVKPFETKDVEITGYYAGNKGTKNEHRLGGFTFMDEGVESRVGGGFSDDQRDEFWEIRDEMVGTIIEVEFMEKTAKGATRHCNFIRRRTYKGERT